MPIVGKRKWHVGKHDITKVKHVRGFPLHYRKSVYISHTRLSWLFNLSRSVSVHK